MNLEGYKETGSINTYKQCHICGETKQSNFTHYDRREVGSTIWVCSTCKLTAQGLQKMRVKIKPVAEMDESELLDEMNDLLETRYKWANIPIPELRKLIQAIRGGIHHAVQKAISELQYDSDESDLGQISGEAFIIRWKQACKHLTRMPESTKYTVADAIIRDLGGMPPDRRNPKETGGRTMNQPVKENQILNVRIESIGAKGDGIAKVNEFAVIVPNTKADKEYTVKITKLKERFAFAEIVEG